MYRIEWKASAAKELRKLPRQAIEKILAAIEGLSDIPRPEGVRKLTGTERTYRIRVGDYRVVYGIFDRLLMIQVIRVRHRKEAYE